MSKPAVPRHSVAATPDGTASPGGKIVSSVAPVLLPVAVTVVSDDTLFGLAEVGCLLLFGGISGKRPTRALAHRLGSVPDIRQSSGAVPGK
jgi:hypothetical protein